MMVSQDKNPGAASPRPEAEERHSCHVPVSRRSAARAAVKFFATATTASQTWRPTPGRPHVARAPKRRRALAFVQTGPRQLLYLWVSSHGHCRHRHRPRHGDECVADRQQTTATPPAVAPESPEHQSGAMQCNAMHVLGSGAICVVWGVCLRRTG